MKCAHDELEVSEFGLIPGRRSWDPTPNIQTGERGLNPGCRISRIAGRQQKGSFSKFTFYFSDFLVAQAVSDFLLPSKTVD